MSRFQFKKWLLLPAALMLVLATALPSRADVQIDKIVVETGGGTATIRIKVSNMAVDNQKGPIVVRLAVRKSDSDRWTDLQTWNDIDGLGNGESASRTWSDPGNALVRQLVASGSFKIKVKATAPGLAAPVEYKQTWKAAANP